MIKNILLSAFLLSAAQLVTAANVSQEEDKLDRLYQAFENRTSELEDIENELFGFDYKLDRAKEDLKTAEADLAAAEREFAKAQAAVAADNSEENQRALKMAEHSRNMSERGVRTRGKRLERVEGSLTELQTAKARLDAQVAVAQKRVQEQEAVLVAAKNAEAAKARDEASRKADDARQQSAAATAAVVAAATVAEVATARVEPVAQLPKDQEPKAQESAATATTSVPAAAPAELSELDHEAQEHARNEVARLQEVLESGDTGRPTFKNLLLTGNRMEPQLFEFLGQDQYRVDVVVSNGRQIFEVGRNKFRRTIPASDNGQTYVFIYDAKRLSRPRLVMFKKSLVEDF